MSSYGGAPPRASCLKCRKVRCVRADGTLYKHYCISQQHIYTGGLTLENIDKMEKDILKKREEFYAKVVELRRQIEGCNKVLAGLHDYRMALKEES
jgi:hypothetical protein